MKRLCLLLGLLFPLHACEAQSVTVGNIWKTTLCIDDTLWVPYTSSGSFKADNVFFLLVTNSIDSFYRNNSNVTSSADSIPVVIGSVGDHWKVRVIASDPYTVSSDSSPEIHVISYPVPGPAHDFRGTSDFASIIGFAGDPI